MGAHHLCDQRIKPPHQFASRFIVMLERSFNQRACIIIIHAIVEVASTLLTKTGMRALWLQACRP